MNQKLYEFEPETTQVEKPKETINSRLLNILFFFFILYNPYRLDIIDEIISPVLHFQIRKRCNYWSLKLHLRISLIALCQVQGLSINGAEFRQPLTERIDRNIKRIEQCELISKLSR